MYRTILSVSLLALAGSAIAKPVSINRPQKRQFGLSSGFGSSGFSHGFGGSGFDDGFDTDSFGDDFGEFSDVLDSSVSESTSISESSSIHSFNDFGGISAFNGFDNFFGAEDFCGFNTVQVFQQSEVVVCQSVDISIIQQRLAVITEFAKRVVLTQLCDVEVQTVAWSQFSFGLMGFTDDLRRLSSRHVSFDSEISSYISDLVDENDVITTNDFGFLGSSIGSHSVILNGDNWNSITSPASVESAFSACQAALPGDSLSIPDITSGTSTTDLPSSSSDDSSDSLPVDTSDSSDSTDSLPPVDDSTDSSGDSTDVTATDGADAPLATDDSVPVDSSTDSTDSTDASSTDSTDASSTDSTDASSTDASSDPSTSSK